MSQAHPQLTDSEKAKIRELHKQGLSGDAIAKQIGRGKSGVYRIIAAEKLGDRRQSRTKPLTPLTQEEKKRIIALHKKGGTTGTAIALEIGRAQSVVSKVIRDAGLSEGDNRGPRRRVDAAAERQIRELHERGHSGRAIAKIVGRSPGAVLGVLRRTGAGVGVSGNGNGSNKLVRPNGGANAPSTLVRGRQVPMLHLWQGQLATLIERIRRVDSGVTSIEVDVASGSYTVNRVSSESGNI